MTIALLVLPLAIGSFRDARAGGLSCSLGEVVIENLKIGHVYSLETLANLPLMITNTADQPATIRIQPLVPDAGELRQGAEAVPSALWGGARPDSFLLAAHETRKVELELRIPDDEKLFGRKFEVIFWSHTLAQAGDLLAYGLKSRVIFSIDPVRDSSQTSPVGDIGISLSPAEITLLPLAAGRPLRLEELLPEPLVLRNQSTHALTIELQALSIEHSAAAPMPGYADLMSIAKLTLAPARITLQPGEQKAVSGSLFVPRHGAVRGGKYVCVVSAAVVDLPVKTQIYSRLVARLR